MSMTLKDLLQNHATKIQRLNDGNRGGTYLQIKCHKVHIPRSCREEFGYVWSSIEDAMGHSQIFNESSIHVPEYKIIRMIFREKPFVFLRDVIKCAVENVLSYDPYLFMMTKCPQITFNNRVFYDSDAKHKAEPSDAVRKIFAQTLAEDYLSGHVLRNNRCLIEKCLHSGNPAVASVAKKFDLIEFYYQKIGDTVDFDGLPWDAMQRNTLCVNCF